MINNNKTDFYMQKKEQVVRTSDIISKKIYDDLKRKNFHNVLDIGAYKGDLSKYFKRKKNCKIIGLNVIDDYKDNFDYFIHKDFLKCEKKDFENLNIDLIVSNPPFHRHPEINELYPFLFLEKIFELFSEKIAVVIIVPSYFLSNSNKRMRKLNELNITKKIVLHKNLFENISIESVILYFNIKMKKQFEYLENKKKEKNKYFKSIALRKDQYDFIKKNIKNFSYEIKQLLKEKYKDFPI